MSAKRLVTLVIGVTAAATIAAFLVWFALGRNDPGHVNPFRLIASESAALAQLGSIYGAQLKVIDETGGECARSLEELGRKNLIHPSVAAGQRDGYRFRMMIIDGDWVALAEPVTPGVTGQRFFAIDSSGQMYERSDRAFSAGGRESLSQQSTGNPREE